MIKAIHQVTISKQLENPKELSSPARQVQTFSIYFIMLTRVFKNVRNQMVKLYVQWAVWKIVS